MYCLKAKEDAMEVVVAGIKYWMGYSSRAGICQPCLLRPGYSSEGVENYSVSVEKSRRL
jgi:hypothetical protein